MATLTSSSFSAPNFKDLVKDYIHTLAGLEEPKPSRNFQELITEEEFKERSEWMKGLNRVEIRCLVCALMEKDLIKGSSHLEIQYGDSITDEKGNKYSGIKIPNDMMKKLMYEMEFKNESSSTSGWYKWSMGGFNSKTSQLDNSEAMCNMWLVDSYSERLCSLSIHYKKTDGTFFHYIGNPVDLFRQVTDAFKPLRNLKAAKKFNV